MRTRETRCELKAAGWNVSAVARKLGLTRSHVYNLLRTFELREA